MARLTRPTVTIEILAEDGSDVLAALSPGGDPARLSSETRFFNRAYEHYQEACAGDHD